MARLIGWWTLVGVLIIGASSLRFEMRHAYAASNSGNPLSEKIVRVLTSGGYRILGLVGDPDNAEGIVGMRFSSDDCPGEMRVAEFPITKIAKAFAEELTTEADSFRYFYYDFSYETAARPSLTVLWAWHLLRNSMGLGADAPTRNQIVVIWPTGCVEPEASWPAIWGVPLADTELEE